MLFFVTFFIITIYQSKEPSKNLLLVAWNLILNMEMDVLWKICLL
jgi:hypothetical protein